MSRFVAVLFRNPHYKALSLFLAISAWLYVQGERVVQGTVQATVEWTFPEGLIPVDPLPTTVVLSLSGSISALRRAETKAGQFGVLLPVDLSEVVESPGEQMIEFAVFEVSGLPLATEITGFSPSSARFSLDEEVEKKVEVQVETVGEPAAGYIVDSISVKPAVAEVRGPRIALEQLLRVKTEPLDLSELQHNRRITVPLAVPRSVRVADNATVDVDVVIEPRLTTKTISNVPVHVRRQEPWRAKTQRVAVTLEGPVAALREVGPDDVTVWVRLPDVPRRTTYLAGLVDTGGVRAIVHVNGGGGEVAPVKLTPEQVEVEVAQ